ncbi:hypothetical protein [Exiguobacterium antarcticum]|uniref:Spore germination protein n=1 Tax=Exiguobacterium antarcticum TaxID=132920 RepID=A0ABT6QXX1_9BACL|nr:hypothetical protein [Exiguobacterium antarcticum]AFS71329.1 Hypothetical protein Eab7_2232 [Exiguobacterium antarcticum B7]MDI3233540.1 hypothetical protein [Exiguobacterium antarcticum]
MLFRYLFLGMDPTIDEIQLRIIYFTELIFFIGLYQITSRFSHQSMILGTVLGVAGLTALLPGAIYILRYNPEDAVIDITFLLIYLLEPLAILAFLVALFRRLYQKSHPKS